MSRSFLAVIVMARADLPIPITASATANHAFFIFDASA